MSDIIAAIHKWAERKLQERLLKKWGMIRTCPWCRNCVETGGKHQMKTADHCEFFDTFTCGVCGGESHWEFGPCPMPRGIGAPPKAEAWAVEAGDQVSGIAGWPAHSATITISGFQTAELAREYAAAIEARERQLAEGHGLVWAGSAP